MYMGKKCLCAMVFCLSSLHAGVSLSLFAADELSKDLMCDGFFVAKDRATSAEEMQFLQTH